MAEKETKLKAGTTGESPAPKEVKEPKEKTKLVEVDGDLLRELIQSNKLLQATVDQLGSNAVIKSQGIQVRKKVKDFDHKMCKWNGKLVLGKENIGTEKRPIHVYQEYNKDTRQMVDFCNLILDGEKETFKIENVLFHRDAQRVVTREISRIKKEDIKEYGMIPKKEMAENGYGMFETTVYVPIEVTEETFDITVKLPEDEGGKEVEINSKWLNM